MAMQTTLKSRQARARLRRLRWTRGVTLFEVLIVVAILFLRNQIKPILRLADAAESFGKGREAPNFRPRGAREVRRAAQAFLEMKSRIERSIEQRTAMLAGVSHDLRTILTRFKLELALIGDSPEVDGMRKDVDEMAGMLEAYLSFARGDSGEIAQPTDMEIALRAPLPAEVQRPGEVVLPARLLLEVVRRLPGPTVSIELRPEQQLVGTAGTRRLRQYGRLSERLEHFRAMRADGW